MFSSSKSTTFGGKSRLKKTLITHNDSVKSVNASTDDYASRLRARDKTAHKQHGEQQPNISFFKAREKGVVKKCKTKNRPLLSPLLNAQHSIRALGIKNLLAEQYISSTLDKPSLFSVNPLHLLKKTQSLGLFSNQFIKPGVCIGEYTGVMYTRKSFKEHLSSNTDADANYAMQVGASIIDARDVGNFTRYINFSDSQANVEFQGSSLRGKKIATVVTTKPIFPGQQLLVDYNVYDPIASQCYYFLNPQDNWQSTAELYAQYKKNYSLQPCPINLPNNDLKTGDPIHVTPLGNYVINNQLITEDSHKLDKQANLPYLTLNQNGEIQDAIEVDLYTPLMIASYTGQVANVQWLIAHGANVDQQQNHSGYCPLLFALEGYRLTEGSKENYLEIMVSLIKNQANVKVHDREDRTFLHVAISILTPHDLQLIMQSLSGDLTELYGYIDKNEEDILIYCIKNKLFEQTRILFNVNPNYLDEMFIKGTLQQRNFNKNKFTDAIQSYSNEEKASFLVGLVNIGVNLDEAAKIELHLANETPSLTM